MLKAEGGMWMHIKEAARQTEMSVRAIKHYEEKGLLQPEKDESGYRVFREQDLERLRQISVYRKLGMEITVIREVLNDPKKERAALERLYEQKQSERALCEQQLCAIRDLLAQAGDYGTLDQILVYPSVCEGLREMLPGALGELLSAHFAPYLQMEAVDEEQQEAYAQIISFWDHCELHLPFWVRGYFHVAARLWGDQIQRLAQAGDTAVKEALKADAQRYEQLKMQVQQNTARSKRFSFSFHLKRRVNRELKRCGYYDVFLPAMERLSPSYRQYRRSLLALEEQICTELGISSSVEGRMGMRSCDEQRMR